MLSLNLLSMEQKKEIRWRRINSLLKQVTFILLVLSIILSILLIGAKRILKNNFEQVVQKDNNIFGFNLEINKINESATFLDQIQKDYINWSEVLVELSLKTPNSIQLTAAQIDKEENNITINGWAAQRDDFLKFKDNLNQSSLFKNIDFPIQNIAEKEDVSFTIKAELNMEP